MVDGDLVSVRGLVDSDFENPLRKFKGIFDGYDTAPATGYAGTRVELKYKDIDEVVVAKGFVYNFPTAVINVGLSNKHKSRWGYLADSIAALIPEGEDIKDQQSKTMVMVYCDGQDGRPEPKAIWSKDADPAEFPDKMVPTAVWVAEEIEGVTAGVAGGEVTDGQSVAEWAEENLIGKTLAEFNKWALADARIRKDTQLQRSILDKSFVTALTQLNKITKDAKTGIYSRP